MQIICEYRISMQVSLNFYIENAIHQLTFWQNVPIFSRFASHFAHDPLYKSFMSFFDLYINTINFSLFAFLGWNREYILLFCQKSMDSIFWALLIPFIWYKNYKLLTIQFMYIVFTPLTRVPAYYSLTNEIKFDLFVSLKMFKHLEIFPSVA